MKTVFQNPRRSLYLLLILLFALTSTLAEARIGGGRSFGSRGSRGFSRPSYSRGQSFSRPTTNPGNATGYSNNQPYSPPPAQPAYQRPSFLRSLGTGIAGGFLGSMLFRSLGGGGGIYAHGDGMNGPMGGSMGGGGIGFLEILIIGAIAFFAIRYFSNRKTATFSTPQSPLQGSPYQTETPQAFTNYGANSSDSPTAQLDPETASDLFFKIQAAWGSRDLTPVSYLIDEDAKKYLDQEIDNLKNRRQLNKLENIAVRNVDVVEEWKDDRKNYSTVRFVANVLDYTISEDTQQIVEGSKTSPVKFEEYWTFAKEDGNSNWKLSGIQQA